MVMSNDEHSHNEAQQQIDQICIDIREQEVQERLCEIVPNLVMGVASNEQAEMELIKFCMGNCKEFASLVRETITEVGWIQRMTHRFLEFLINNGMNQNLCMSVGKLHEGERKLMNTNLIGGASHLGQTRVLTSIVQILGFDCVKTMSTLTEQGMPDAGGYNPLHMLMIPFTSDYRQEIVQIKGCFDILILLGVNPLAITEDGFSILELTTELEIVKMILENVDCDQLYSPDTETGKRTRATFKNNFGKKSIKIIE